MTRAESHSRVGSDLLRDMAIRAAARVSWAASCSADTDGALRAASCRSLSRAAVLVPLVDRPEGLQVLLTAARLAPEAPRGPGQLSGRAHRERRRRTRGRRRSARPTRRSASSARSCRRAGYLQDHLVDHRLRRDPGGGFREARASTLRLDETEVEDASRCRSHSCSIPANHLPRDAAFRQATRS